MFDKPNQLIFYINVLIALFGIFFAACGYIIVGLIIAACAVLLIRDQLLQNKSEFTISQLEKTLSIVDTCGSKAIQTQKQLMTACHSGNTEFWFNNIHSTGTIQRITIDGMAPSEKKSEGNNTQVCMKFSPGLKVTKEFEATLSIEHKNAFVNTAESFSHTVDTDTKLLRLIVELPQGRPASSAEVFCNPADGSQIPVAIIEQSRIIVEVPEPKLGTEYGVRWNWPREGVAQRIGCLFKG